MLWREAAVDTNVALIFGYAVDLLGQIQIEEIATAAPTIASPLWQKISPTAVNGGAIRTKD
jgi:hypothetical protein